MEGRLFETLEDHDLWNVLLEKDWRGRLKALPIAQAERLRFLLDKAGEPLATRQISRQIGVLHNVKEDRHVDIHEASRIIGFSEKWLYRRAKELPFTRVTTSGRLRFSANGIQEWLIAGASGA